MLLASASGGPRTLALLGSAGTGKTWLLNRLVPELRSRGRQVRLEQRGDVSPQLPLGAVLLVDEASRLDQDSLERMANQQRGLVILADVPAFARRLDALSRPPATITLPTIDPEELPSFVADWAAAHDVSVAITDDAMTRLVVHTGGTPRLIIQLAKAALALADSAGRTEIVGADIDDAAALKNGSLDVAPSGRAAEAKPDLSPPTPEQTATVLPLTAAMPEAVAAATPVARFRWRVAASIALPALAACVVVGWVGTHALPEPTTAAPAPAGVPANQTAGPAEPPAETFTLATSGAPNLVAASDPPIASLPIASLPTPSSPVASLPVEPSAIVLPQAADPPRAMPLAQSVPPVAPSPLPPVADPAPLVAASTPTAPTVSEPSRTPLATPSLPELTASLSPPLAPEVALSIAPQDTPPASSAPDPQPNPAPDTTVSGAPGLVFIAGPGDTLATLYAQVYRGHRPPPFNALVAANPRPMRPGALVVFPPPPGGWNPP